MVKYIVKRILLSLLILFGVSIIIYAMVRMMPTDYVDQKMQSQVDQGLVNDEDILRMKKLCQSAVLIKMHNMGIYTHANIQEYGSLYNPHIPRLFYTASFYELSFPLPLNSIVRFFRSPPRVQNVETFPVFAYGGSRITLI